MDARAALKLMLVCVLALPVVLAVLHWVIGLLSAMGDSSAASVLQHLNTAISVFWLVSVVGLVVALAVNALDEPREE